MTKIQKRKLRKWANVGKVAFDFDYTIVSFPFKAIGKAFDLIEAIRAT